MRLIAKQPYIKIQREVTSIQQKDIEDERTLYLYEDKVVTAHREFPIENVTDISYRKFGVGAGLLYIHTLSGLFTYTVKTSTKEFINEFHKLKGNP